jgi:putative membrane protein
MRLSVVVFAASLALAVFPAAGQTKLSKQDSTFLKEAAGGGVGEVQLGELAQQRASSAAVKQFGQRMVDDHTKANAQLKSVATQRGESVAEQPSSDARKAYDKLSRSSGPDFDRGFADQMVKDHQKTVKLFRDEAKNGKDPGLKDFAAQTLPTLEGHLSEAQQLQKQVKAGS